MQLPELWHYVGISWKDLLKVKCLEHVFKISLKKSRTISFYCRWPAQVLKSNLFINSLLILLLKVSQCSHLGLHIVWVAFGQDKKQRNNQRFFGECRLHLLKALQKTDFFETYIFILWAHNMNHVTDHHRTPEADSHDLWGSIEPMACCWAGPWRIIQVCTFYRTFKSF